MFQHMLVSWKSTVSGILTVALATIGPLMVMPDFQTVVSPKELKYLMIFSVVGKVWVSLIQQDAGVVVATSPANPVPHAEPSHEVPDSPMASVVKDASKAPEVKP